MKQETMRKLVDIINNYLGCKTAKVKVPDDGKLTDEIFDKYYLKTKNGEEYIYVSGNDEMWDRDSLGNEYFYQIGIQVDENENIRIYELVYLSEGYGDDRDPDKVTSLDDIDWDDYIYRIDVTDDVKKEFI